MAPLIHSVHLDDSTLDRQNSVLVSADVQFTDGGTGWVVVQINGRVLQMQQGPGGSGRWTYRRRVHAVEAGEFDGTGYVVAYEFTGETCDCNTKSFSITISAVDPIQPEEFYKALLDSNLDFASNQDISIDIMDTKARVNKLNGKGVVITPSSRLRTERGKSQYKDVKYPLTIMVYSSESRKDVQRLMEAVLDVEEANVNLSGSDVFDFIDIKDDGKVIPGWKTYVITHDINLVKYYKKVQITGY